MVKVAWFMGGEMDGRRGYVNNETQRVIQLPNVTKAFLNTATNEDGRAVVLETYRVITREDGKVVCLLFDSVAQRNYNKQHHFDKIKLALVGDLPTTPGRSVEQLLWDAMVSAPGGLEEKGTP